MYISKTYFVKSTRNVLYVYLYKYSFSQLEGTHKDHWIQLHAPCSIM